MSKDTIIPFFDFEILGVFEAEDLVDNDPLDKWNVISLYAPHWDWEGLWHKGQWVNYKPLFPKAKRLSQHKFHDIDMAEGDMILCREDHIREILDFSQECIGESVIVHCHAGQSRSTAMAFLVLLNALKDKTEFPAEEAMRYVVKNRPIATPNRHILNIGIPLIAKDEETQIRWFRELYNSRAMASLRLS